MLEKQEKSVWQIFFLGVVVAGILALRDLVRLAADKGFSLTQPKWAVLIAVISILIMGAFFLFFSVQRRFFVKLKNAYENFLSLGAPGRFFFYFLFGVSLFFLPFLVLQPYLGRLLGNLLWFKLFLFLLNSFLGASLLRVAKKRKDTKGGDTKGRDTKEGSASAPAPNVHTWLGGLAVAALGQLLVYHLIMLGLYISDYPFALGWTRDSRYYYASLFFAERIYGKKLPLPILHPSLHFLYSFPFLLGKLPIWVHRAWSILLKFGLTALVSAALLKRYRTAFQQKSLALFLGVWSFLFLLTGSIYAHLLIPVYLIFAFVDLRKPRRTWLIVILASLWAGVSRINWFPAPAMLAALLYFMETEAPQKRVWRYLLQPAGWFIVGVGSAFLSQAIYIQASGNSSRAAFFSSLSSELIWERLLPNNTYAPGILLGALLLSFFWLYLAFKFWWRREFHPLRVAGIFLPVLALFVGGSVVSVKIGGGADLHNMDAYFVSILLIGIAALARGFQLAPAKRALRAPLLFAAIFALAWLILRGGGTLGYDRVGVNASLNALQAEVADVASQGGEALFISQRHLLALGMIEGVPLVPEYEKDVLMEMVMSHNRPYLDGFYDDLREQRFALIVVDPQTDTLLSESRSFAAENNIWILKVTRPLWCYYEPVALYENVGVELYMPRDEFEVCQ